MFISIGGNIGSGKSTLLAELQAELNPALFSFLPEPVAEWTTINDEHGKNPLQYFYENPHKYAFNLQILAFITRLNLIQKAMDGEMEQIIISERSLEEDRYVFAQKLYDSGFISGIEFATYKHWFNSQSILPDIQIYIDTPHQICYERILKRGRPEELPITKDYIHSLETYYNKFLSTSKTKTYVINGTKTVASLKEEVLSIIKIIT